MFKYPESNDVIWPHMEVLDLNHNKLNDFYEIVQLLNGTALRKHVIKIIAIRGNSFYNYYECEQR